MKHQRMVEMRLESMHGHSRTRQVSSRFRSHVEKGSLFAAFDVNGFVPWDSTPGTFDRLLFHDVFGTKIAPYLNP